MKSSPTMLCPGKGILAIWHDLDPAGEAEFREWHTREHMPERISVPGFLRGCRYSAHEGSPQVFNFYQTETPEILTSEPYLDRLNSPTPWTRRVVPLLRDVNRSAGRVVASFGIGEGGAVTTLRCVLASDQTADLQKWLTDVGLPQVVERPGIVAGHLWNADPAASTVSTAESRARSSLADFADWSVAIEGNDVDFVKSAGQWLQAQSEFSQVVTADKTNVGIYRLQHRMSR